MSTALTLNIQIFNILGLDMAITGQELQAEIKDSELFLKKIPSANTDLIQETRANLTAYKNLLQTFDLKQ